jgi:hypothetical protein
LFGSRLARGAASNGKTPSNRGRRAAAAPSIKSVKPEHRRALAQRSQTTSRQKIAGNRSSLGTAPSKPSSARKTAAQVRFTKLSITTFQSESSRIPQSAHSSGAAGFRSGVPGGISGGAAGLRSFGHPFGGGMGSSGIGGGLGGGHGFGHAGGR